MNNEQYLDFLRKRNVEAASKCQICGQPTIGINADGYSIRFVCKDHLKNIEDVILDTSNPGVLHYIYPNGKEPGLMDPNVGGYKPRNKDIWETQVSFEE